MVYAGPLKLLPACVAFSPGYFEMAGIVDTSEAEDGQGFDIKVYWIGFDVRNRSWVVLSTVWDGIPLFVKSELRKLRIDRGVCDRVFRILQYYALSYWCLLHCQARLVYF